MISVLAQQSYGGGGSGAGEAAAAGIVLGVIFLVLVFFIAIAVLIAWLIYKPYTKVPVEFRQMQPGMVFLMLIPLFGLVWVFFIALQVSDSFKAYFDSVADPSVGDAGKGVGLGWAICTACSIIPFVGGLVGLAALVLLIIFVVKLWGMAGRIGQIEQQSMAAVS